MQPDYIHAGLAIMIIGAYIWLILLSIRANRKRTVIIDKKEPPTKEEFQKSQFYSDIRKRPSTKRKVTKTSTPIIVRVLRIIKDGRYDFH
jgi:hypothetical protein